MFGWILRKVKRFRYVIRNAQKEVYLVRYRLLDTKRLGIYLHHVLRSDDDRALHDHPFDFRTVILWRGYREYLFGANEVGTRIQVPHNRRIGDTLYRTAETAHRLQLYQNKDCVDLPAWTLFIRGRKRREWGFHDEASGEWINWKDYAEKAEEPKPVACPPRKG